MKYEDYPLHANEYPILQTERRTEWGMALLCLISAPLIALVVWGSTLGIWIGGLTAAVLLLLYGIHLILAGKHDWAMVTNERVVLCRQIAFREEIREVPIHEVMSYRLYESARSSRKGMAQGELDLKLKNGKHFSIPPLIEMNDFLEALRRSIDYRKEEES